MMGVFGSIKGELLVKYFEWFKRFEVWLDHLIGHFSPGFLNRSNSLRN